MSINVNNESGNAKAKEELKVCSSSSFGASNFSLKSRHNRSGTGTIDRMNLVWIGLGTNKYLRF